MDARTVCLITPPSPFLLDERVMPFLGPLNVAASLRQRGHKVEMLDLAGYRNYTAIVRKHALESTSTVFGLTATTPQFPAAVEIVKTLRIVRPDARIILGGPHATLTVAAYKYERAKKICGRAHRAYAQIEECFDVIVSGDGEIAIFSALLPDAPKLIDGDGKGSDFPELRLTKKQLNQLPLPARDLIDLKSYHYKVDGLQATTLIAQLGCPMPCGFCAGRGSPMLRQIRTRSIENIVEELVHLYKEYGYHGFMFYDDELNISDKTIVPLMRAIGDKQRDLGVEWRLRGFVKSELFTDEQARLMFNAGFRQILVGFESGSPKILKNIKKLATREQNTRCVQIAHRYGLSVKALMSLGHPGESHETIRQTKEWLLEACPEDFDVAVITPYPGSPYYDHAVEIGPGRYVYTINGDRLFQEEVDFAKIAHYFKGIPGEYVSHVYTDHLSAEEIAFERDQLEDKVRNKLHIPYPKFSAATAFDCSMGQTSLPPQILRVSG